MSTDAGIWLSSTKRTGCAMSTSLTNETANTLKVALYHAPKVLLTATPLQNSFLELFGLVSFIDEHVFGDLESFRAQFLFARTKRSSRG